MKKTNRVVVITGDSSGFGLEMAKLFIANGDKVYGISRREFSLDGLTHYACDISEPENCAKVVCDIASREENIDILINNAGFGISGSVEDTSIESAKKIFDVNFFGAFYLTKYALPFLRIKGGKIINTSSIASVVPLPFQAFYSATKSALDTLFSALREEVHDYNVTVTSIMPGDAKTDFTKNRVKNQSNQAYKEVCEKSVKTMEKDEAHGITPQTVACVAFKIANKKRPPYTKLVGKKDSFLCFLFKILPKRFRSFLVRKIYASK